MPRPKNNKGGFYVGNGGDLSTAENKPRGKMSAYAFFTQICRDEHRKKHPDENVSFAEFAKKCAERWKTMTEREKRRFNQMAEQDRRRYDLEMAAYVPPAQNQPAKSKARRKKDKDPNAPKRSMSAFFWYSQQERPRVREANPKFSVGEVAKELGRRWGEATPEQKVQYEKLAEGDRERYTREKRVYQQSLKRQKKNGPPAPQDGHNNHDRNHGVPPPPLQETPPASLDPPEDTDHDEGEESDFTDAV